MPSNTLLIENLRVHKKFMRDHVCACMQRLSPEEEAAKLRRTIFVGNLPPDVKKKMIQQEFGQ